MAKGSKKEYNGLGFGKKGRQDVTKSGWDASAAFKNTATPKSITKYLGKGAKLKHDEN
jgi:hypothetical protein